MNRLSTQKRAEIIHSLVEGNSINATCRMTSAAKMTVLKLIRDLGEATSRYQDTALRNLPCKRIQADELWAFCHAKAKNVPEQHRGEFGYGDVWTWTAIDPDTKLMVTWLVGERDEVDGLAFMLDLRERVSGRIQLSTDAGIPYRGIVERAFGATLTTPRSSRTTAWPRARMVLRPPAVIAQVRSRASKSESSTATRMRSTLRRRTSSA